LSKFLSIPVIGENIGEDIVWTKREYENKRISQWKPRPK